MKLQALSLLLSAAPALSAVVSSGGISGDASQHIIGRPVVHNGIAAAGDDFTCDLPPPVSPDSDGLPPASELFSGPKALGLQVHRHAALIAVPTVSYDDMADIGKDPRWDVFFDFQNVLKDLFPTVHKRMNLTTVNTHGLVFFIEGSNADLQPIMLTAHQDVVPVPDPSAWVHPPFSGHYDGTWLWGRGSVDDKNSLTAIMSVMETLLQNATWTPRRSILLAFGFDEESSGYNGAGKIAAYIERTFGKDSMVMVLDEGGSGIETVRDADSGSETVFALPGVLEKGHVDIYYELHVRGGHSSMPLPHTGIGIAAEIVAALENHPYTPKILAGSPMHSHMVCRARYTPEQDPDMTRLVHAGDLDALAQLLASYSPALDFRMRTSQAIDVVAGGLKINAMPEKVDIGVNYRVAQHNSLAEVRQRSVDVLKPVLDKYQITLKAFGEPAVPPSAASVSAPLSPKAPAVGDFASLGGAATAQYHVDYNATLIIEARSESDASPVSPTTGDVWDLFSGSIQHTLAADGSHIVPVGDVMNGNTDVRHYLGLSHNVYRWMPLREGMYQNFHAVDEGIHMESHMETVRFYYDLIRNFDSSEL